MITVAILVNGNVLVSRAAVNRLKTEGAYICDDGTTRIEHDPADGAIALAHKMLDTIRLSDLPPPPRNERRAGQRD